MVTESGVRSRHEPAVADDRRDAEVDALLSADGDFVAACARYEASDSSALLDQCLTALLPIHEVGTPMFCAALALPVVLTEAPPHVPTPDEELARSASRLTEDALGLAPGSVKVATVALPLNFLQTRLAPSQLARQVWEDKVPALAPQGNGSVQPYLLPLTMMIRGEELALLQRARREFFTRPTPALGRLRAFVAERLERDAQLPRGSVAVFMPLFLPWAAAALRRFALNAALGPLQPQASERLVARLSQDLLAVALFGERRVAPVIFGLGWRGESRADAQEAVQAAARRYGIAEPALLE